MFAARLAGPRKFEFIEMPLPDIESAPPGSVLVKTRRATICGSDLPYFLKGAGPPEQPGRECFPAHECVGVVAASTSRRFKAGDAVLAEPDQFTGLAEYYMARDWRTVRIPNDGNWNNWVLAQPLGTVLWGLRKLEALFHRQVLVLGQGAIGLLVTQMAANLGASTIIAVDPLQYRLDISTATGATHSLADIGPSLFEAVAQISGAHGIDVVVEAVGHQTDTINTAIRLVRHSGTILAYGVPDQDIYPIQFRELFRKNVRLITTVTAIDMPLDFALAVQYLKGGRVDVGRFVTHEFPFRRLHEAFDLFSRRSDCVVKVVINYDRQ